MRFRIVKPVGKPTGKPTGKQGKPPKPGATPPNSPVRRRDNDDNTDGLLYIMFYTGSAIPRLVGAVRHRFKFMCVDRSLKKLAVAEPYIDEKFHVASLYPSSSVALVAAQERNGQFYISGMGLATLSSVIPKTSNVGISSMDLKLLCAGGGLPDNIDRPAVRGLGKIMLAAFEKFAYENLGVRMVTLESISVPNTWNFYRKNGYKRVPFACDAKTLERQERLVAHAMVQGMTSLDPHVWPKAERSLAAYRRQYLNALQGALIDKNKLGSTVFMSKCLGSNPQNPFGVEYPVKSGEARYRYNVGQEIVVAEVWDNGVRRHDVEGTFPSLSELR
jgi:hypothetical protein